MSSRHEMRDAIEGVLVKYDVQKYVFSHSAKHANVTWWLNGRVRFYTFPQKPSTPRMKQNIVADIRRHCKTMLAAQGNGVGLA